MIQGVSVIVPTYNGERKIPIILEALSNQTFKDFEIVIAIDGSTDNTEDQVRKWESKFANLRIAVQTNKGRAAIRNFGAMEAGGDLLIFYDDDMIPDKTSVERHFFFHTKNGSNVILGGNAAELSKDGLTDIQQYRAWLTKKWISKFEEGVNLIPSSDIFLTAANFSIKKKLFNELHGFDERLNDIEDFEFAFRASKNNIQLYFDKLNVAIHNDLITAKSYLKRTKQYTNAQHKLSVLKPEVLSVTRKFPGFKRLIYWMFSFSFWIRIIDSNALIFFMPIKMRYVLYKFVLYSQGVVFCKCEIEDGTNKR